MSSFADQLAMIAGWFDPLPSPFTLLRPAMFPGSSILDCISLDFIGIVSLGLICLHLALSLATHLYNFFKGIWNLMYLLCMVRII
jgi:hypothetical protein